MTADPPRRADGRCAQCGKPLIAGPPKSMPKTLRPMFLAALEAEPFCSAGCCRTWHNAPLPTGRSASPDLAERVPKHFGTAERQAYRNKHKVPCEGGCGTLVEGKGRGGNPDRPYLCIGCYRASRAKAAA